MYAPFVQFPLCCLSSRIVDIAQNVSFIAADAVVLAVTIYHTYRTIKASRDANVPATFSSIFLRAGLPAVHLNP